VNTFVTPRWLMEESVVLVTDRVVPEIVPAVRAALATMTDEQVEEFACELGRAVSPEPWREDDES
jgi:hypothetical protein